MRRRYVLAPEAAQDLAGIWRYIKREASVEMADRVEAVIRDQIVFLAATPGAGHWRKDLTDEPVKFFPVYSYLIAYRPTPSRCRSRLFPRSSRRRAASETDYDLPQSPEDARASGAEEAAHRLHPPQGRRVRPPNGNRSQRLRESACTVDGAKVPDQRPVDRACR